MAALSNTLSNVIPQILAQGLVTLRENAIMPRLVNNDLSAEAAEKGDTIDVPIAAPLTARDVVPDQTATNVTITPSKVVVSLVSWKESVFMLTDKDIAEAMSGIIPRQAEEAVKAIANNIDDAILALYQNVYWYGGTAGTTPFAGTDPVTTLAAFKTARTKLIKSLSPGSNRFVVLDPDAEANALTMSPFLKADERGDQGAIVAGQIGKKLGFDWWMDQNIPSHTAGGVVTAAGTAKAPSVAVQVVATSTAKTITAALASSTNIGELQVGDLFTIENNSNQQFVVTTALTSASVAAATTISISFEPYLEVTASTTNDITFIGTRGSAYVNNVLAHRDAFAFASRPLASVSQAGLGSIFQSAIDPVSGLALRLEVSRQNKMQTWSFDVLYGVKAVRPQLAARLLG
jgi:hypothetical protein